MEAGHPLGPVRTTISYPKHLEAPDDIEYKDDVQARNQRHIPALREARFLARALAAPSELQRDVQLGNRHSRLQYTSPAAHGLGSRLPTACVREGGVHRGAFHGSGCFLLPMTGRTYTATSGPISTLVMSSLHRLRHPGS